MNPEVMRSGRPHGGCAILWNSTIGFNILPIKTVSNRLNCINISSKDYNFLLFNVYMPCDSRSEVVSFNQFQDVLAEISIISQNNWSDFLIIAGDFDVDFSRDTPQTKELTYFCKNESLTICDTLSISNMSRTFECKKTGSKSNLDHILITDAMKEFVMKCFTHDTINNNSDHIAVLAEVELCHEYLATKQLIHIPKTAWYKATIYDKMKYKEQLDMISVIFKFQVML